MQNTKAETARSLVSLLCDILQGKREFEGVHAQSEFRADDLAAMDYYNNYVALVHNGDDTRLVLVVDEGARDYASKLAYDKNMPNMMDYMYFGSNTDPCDIVTASTFAHWLDTC